MKPHRDLSARSLVLALGPAILFAFAPVIVSAGPTSDDAMRIATAEEIAPQAITTACHIAVTRVRAVNWSTLTPAGSSCAERPQSGDHE